MLIQAIVIVAVIVGLLLLLLSRRRISTLSPGQVLLGIATVVALVGLAIILQSTTMGIDAASDAVRRQGGSMDTVGYQAVLGGYAASYRLIGGVLFAVGVFAVLRRPW